MSQRKPTVGGNWKMNLTKGGSHALARSLIQGLRELNQVDVAVFPAFPYLAEVGSMLRAAKAMGMMGGRMRLGAQDFYDQPDGAFTGEISLSMLKDLDVHTVLVGHSERRHVMGETDELINRKVRAALAAGMEVVLCVGEKLQQREQGLTDGINAGQTVYGLANVKAQDMAHITIAYEPVWAIGTGKNATPADAQAAHLAIRKTLAAMYGESIAQSVRIQYGGSVKPANAKELFSQPDVDGGLIGGASLKAEDFLAIVQAAAK